MSTYLIHRQQMLSPQLKRAALAALLVLCILYLVHRALLAEQAVPYAYRDQFITVLRTDDASSSSSLVDRSAADDLQHLVNLTTFNYTLLPDSCPTGGDPLLGILIITSYAGHDELRSAHRQAMPATLLAGLGLRRVFLLAALPPTERFMTQAALQAEHNRFGDLVQGNFLEAYRNLTYKHTMGLRWASRTRPGDCHHRARFIVKADDDTVFDLYHLHANLLDLSDTEQLNSDRFLAGFVLDDKKPIRNAASKWYVSRAEFAGDRYPDYLSGWLYLTNPATARRLMARAQREPFMWIDDTWMTGVLREPLGIGLVRLNRWFSANAEFLDCCVADLRRWGVRCDYTVGPNGGDARLIGEFARAVARCYVDDDGQMLEGVGEEMGGEENGGVVGCKERGPDQSLATSCVGRKKNLVGDHGRALVEAIKL